LRKTLIVATALSIFLFGALSPQTVTASEKGVVSAKSAQAGVLPKKEAKVLTRKYSWGEKSTNVVELQKVLSGKVRVTGKYDLNTRYYHKDRLNQYGLTTKRVPSIPKSAIAPYPSDPSMRCPKWEAKLEEHGLEPVDYFSYIAWRESRCMPKAVGWNYRSGMSRKDCGSGLYFEHMKCKAVKSWDVGLLQINSSWNTVTQTICGKNTRTKVLMNPDCNLKVARHLMLNGGYGHWSGQSSID
jgi:hypothetical protein